MNVTEVFAKLHDLVPQSTLFAIFWLICLVFGVSSFVLLFHWNRYSIDKARIVVAKMIYFLGGLLILLLAAISVTLY